MKKTASLILALILIFALAVTAYAAAASGDTLVYRTASGKKYHTMTCSQLNGKDSIEITLEEAVKAGLEPCSKCNPPTLASGGSSEAAATTGTSSASAAAPAAATAARTGGFLSGVSPILTFFIGVVVGALVITYIRGRIIMKQEEAEAAAEAEEPEEK